MQFIRSAAVIVGFVAACHSKHDNEGTVALPTEPSPDPSPKARAQSMVPAGSAAGSAAGPGSAASPGSAAMAAGSADTGVATDSGEVRKPVAADLPEYLKAVKGTGSKLNMTMETSLGTLHCELYGDKAPMTVANFVGLATGKKSWLNPKTGQAEKGKHYFDGLTFHRVIPGFMIQGGDPLGSGTGGPGYAFQDEFVDGLAMEPGTLAMANAGKGPDRGGTNGSQFFVMEGARPDLVGKHTIFGKCAELDVVKKITGTPRDGSDKPNTAVTINKVTFSKS